MFKTSWKIGIFLRYLAHVFSLHISSIGANIKPFKWKFGRFIKTGKWVLKIEKATNQAILFELAMVISWFFPDWVRGEAEKEKSIADLFYKRWNVSYKILNFHGLFKQYGLICCFFDFQNPLSRLDKTTKFIWATWNIK